MITAERIGGTLEAGVWQFTGLHDDEKPTQEWEDSKILNGSNFFEMDTLSVSFYDGATDTWITKEG